MTKVRELTGERTEQSSTWLNSDGTRTAKLTVGRQNFKDKAGRWTPIDTSVVELADGSGFENAADSWTYQFRPTDRGGVTVVSDQGQRLTFAPVSDRAVRPERLKDADGVVYRDVQPGIDVRYLVTANGLKEDVVLKSRDAASSLQFVAADATFATEKRPTEAGGKGSSPLSAEDDVLTAASTDGADPIRFDDVSVSTADQFVVTDDAGASVDVVDPTRVQVGVSKEWLAGLPDSAFPVVIDPTTQLGGVFLGRFSSTGTANCDSNTAGCQAAVGEWLGVKFHSILEFPLTSFHGTTITDAYVHVDPITAPPAFGDDMWILAKDQWTYDPGYLVDAWYLDAGGSDFDAPAMTTWFANEVTALKPKIWTQFIGWDVDGSFSATYFNAYWMVTYSPIPASASNPITPEVGRTITTLQPTLTSSPIAVLNGGAAPPVYEYKVTTGPVPSVATTGIIEQSAALSTPQWTVSANKLKDGAVYYWQVKTSFPALPGNGSTWGAVGSFRVNRRLGKGAVAPMDGLGPVSVNLASGNATTGWASPTVATLGGAAGISAVFNSLTSTQPDGALPSGWTLSGGFDPEFQSLDPNLPSSDNILVKRTDGSTLGFTKTTGGIGVGYTAPPGETAQITQIGTGYQLIDGDGTTYGFDSTGSLTDIASVSDDRTPAAMQYMYTPVSGSPRLTSVIDPVGKGGPSERKIQLQYQGQATCPTPTAGTNSNGQTLVAAPAGMLCRAIYMDGTETKFFYQSVGSGLHVLARIEDPGSQITDFGYDAARRVAAIADPLAVEAKAYGVRTDTQIVTAIAYGTDGRTSSVTAPAPTSGAPRPQHSYTYTIGAPGAGEARVDVAGLSRPSGQLWTSKATFDDGWRSLTTTDVMGRTASTFWNEGLDKPYATTDAAGMFTRYFYDPITNQVNETYGPAPADWFYGGIWPYTQYAALTPHTTKAFDQNVGGLAAITWPNATGSGAVKTHDTVYLGSTAVQDWGAGSPSGLGVTDNWYTAMTGTILTPDYGNYTVYLWANGETRLYVDDVLYNDDMGTGGINDNGTMQHATSDASFSSLAGVRHKVRVEFKDTTGNAQVDINWISPSAPGGQLVPTQYLSPAYGLETQSNTWVNGTTTNRVDTAYAYPHLGQGVTTTVDPGGLNLVSKSTIEAPGTANGWLRPTTRELPSGVNSRINYAYYPTVNAPTALASVAIPASCSAIGLSGTAIQYGLAWKTTGADPDANAGTTGVNGPIVREVIHDSRGRVTASRVEADGATAWTCTKFDTRGRPTQQYFPASAGSAARTVTVAYTPAYGAFTGGDPTVTKTTDTSLPAGQQDTYLRVDLLGRPIEEVDVWGTKTLTSYDQAGRITTAVVSRSGTALHTLAYAYWSTGFGTNQLNTVTMTPSGGSASTLATVTYDLLGREGLITYANGTTRSAPTRDVLDRVTSQSYGQAGANTLNGVQLRVQHDGKCLDVEGPSTANGAALQQWSCLGAGQSNQLFNLVPVNSTWFKIVANNSSKCVEVAGASTAEGAVVNQQTCTGSPQQLWRTQPVTGGYQLVAQHSAKCLGIPNSSTNDGQDSDQRTCGNATITNQIWKVTNPTTSAEIAPPGPASLTSNTVTRDLVGRVTDSTIDGVDPNPGGANYGYDAAGRLTTRWEAGLQVSDRFDAYNGSGNGTMPAGCSGPQTAAGKNSNRLVGDSMGYCYDWADRLTAISPAWFNTFTYDLHGNMVVNGLTANPASMTTYGFDIADRHLSTFTQDQATSVVNTRDATDRIVERASIQRLSPSSSVATTSTGATTLVEPVPVAGQVAGDVAVAQVVVSGTAAIAAPTGWTLRFSKTGTAVWVGMFTHTVAAGDPTTVTFNLATTRTAAGGVTIYRGVNPTSPTVTAATATSTATVSHVAPSLTITGTGTRLLNYVGMPATATLTAGTGTSETRDINTGTGGVTAFAAEEVRPGSWAATATGTRTHTSSVATDAALVSVALNPIRHRQAYTGTGDTSDLTYDGTFNLTERTFSLPGGVMVDWRSASDIRWSYSNLHGDVVAEANNSGAKIGATRTLNAYGVPSSTPIDNQAGTTDYAWHGQAQRPYEQGSGVPYIEMGARIYIPLYGRFTETDPVEGGTANDYAYVDDPVNDEDLTGTHGSGTCPKGFRKTTIPERGGGMRLSCVPSKQAAIRGGGGRQGYSPPPPPPGRGAGARNPGACRSAGLGMIFAGLGFLSIGILVIIAPPAGALAIGMTVVGGAATTGGAVQSVNSAGKNC